MYSQRAKIRRLSVRMAKWHRLLTFGMECCRSSLCMHIWTIPNVLAHTHNIFQIISMWVSLYFDFSFRSVPKFSLSLLDKSAAFARKFMCVCVCITSVSIDAYVCTLSFVSSYFHFPCNFSNVSLMQCSCARNAFICAVIS